MVSERTESISNESEGEDINKVSSPFSHSKVFREQFPYYLAIGMTPEQYWDGDSQLVKYFREAEELRNTKRNQELWLQGMYVYEAVRRIAPVLIPFNKNAKIEKYVEKPFPLTEKQLREYKLEEEKQKQAKMKAFMEQYMIKNNLEKKGGEQNG